jgi:signal transduction histidine kinase
MKKIIKQNPELFWYRIMLCVIVVAVPLYGVLLKLVSPDCVDYMGHRFIQSGVLILLIIASYLSGWVRGRIVELSSVYVLVLNLWVLWLCFLNDFAIEFSIGLFTSFCTLNLAIRRPVLYYLFSAIVIIATIFFVWQSESPDVNPALMTFVFIALGCAFTLTSSAMLNFEQKLSEMNLSLEEKVLERTLIAEDRAKQLFIKNQDLEQFAYIASHDLKSPLRNIGSFVQLIQRKLKNIPDDDLQDYLNFVIGSVGKMNSLIDDILLYSRLGDKTLMFRKVNIQAVICEAASFFQGEIQQKKGVIYFDVFHTEMFCDARQMEQLFRNLVENALKYNTSKKPEITIGIREKQHEYLFSVKDNGIGIDKEFFEKIFNMFQRLHTEQEYAGTGMGLALCKRIVENHNGKIWVESEPGKGTTFYFTISKKLAQRTPKLEMEVMGKQA